jgi:hypothetical protein
MINQRSIAPVKAVGFLELSGAVPRPRGGFEVDRKDSSVTFLCFDFITMYVRERRCGDGLNGEGRDGSGERSARAVNQLRACAPLRRVKLRCRSAPDHQEIGWMVTDGITRMSGRQEKVTFWGFQEKVTTAQIKPSLHHGRQNKNCRVFFYQLPPSELSAH